MKGDPKILKTLNMLLADELTAINQYMVHSEMCDNWGYGRLHEKIAKRANDEMKQAEKLIVVFFLGGTPIVSNLKTSQSAPCRKATQKRSIIRGERELRV
jgi:bacterioferritin